MKPVRKVQMGFLLFCKASLPEGGQYDQVFAEKDRDGDCYVVYRCDADVFYRDYAKQHK